MGAGRKALARLVAVGGDTPQFHLLMAKALLSRSDDKKAIDELKKAEASDANLPFLHFNFGLAYLHLEDSKQRKTSFERISQRNRICLQPRATGNLY